MRKLHSILKKIFTLSGLLLWFLAGQAQTAAPTDKPAIDTPVAGGAGFVFDANAALMLMAVILLAVIVVLIFTLRSSMELYRFKKLREKEQQGGTGKMITMLLVFLFLGIFSVMAQTPAVDTTATTAATAGGFSFVRLLRYMLLFVIALELVAIFVIIRWIRFFTGIEGLKVERKKTGEKKESFGKWWTKFNKIKPIEKEEAIVMEHDYDGIKELDNVLPPWFTWAFIASIVFGIGYLWRYQFAANPAPDQYQEYNNTVVEAKIKQEAYLKSKGGDVDETNVKMLGTDDIAKGKTLFAANCIVCHGDKGQGGVGPNLTDDYWLHGGRINDVFKTIKYGVVEKGMQSWKDVFSATQIAELSSYIMSLHGSNPPGAKAPQGDLFKDAGGGGAAAPGGDSTATAKAATDSTVKK
jgi:cytochrome c oxidase cbb3-type subunit 3